MPYLKLLSGHRSSTKDLAAYLTKGGRDLGRSYVNTTERGIGGLGWAEQMDATRALLGTDRAPRTGRLRTYEHIILSLDPKDSSVTLEEFRDFTERFVEDWFGPGGRLGSYQCAIVFHDDNEARALHAHIVVNNAELSGAGRVSTALTPHAVGEMRADLNRRSLDAGWHAFTQDGRSMTASEMEAAGARPSTTWRDHYEALERSGAESPTAEVAEVGGAPEPPRTPSRAIGEAQRVSRDHVSWKDDLRRRIEIAAAIARDAAGFIAELVRERVRALFTKAGEIKYESPFAPGHPVLGSTLGDAYTVAGVSRQIARDPGPVRSDLTERVGALTLDDYAELEEISELMRYNAEHKIRGIDSYPATEQGARMRERAQELGLFRADLSRPTAAQDGPHPAPAGGTRHAHDLTHEERKTIQ